MTPTIPSSTSQIVQSHDHTVNGPCGDEEDDRQTIRPLDTAGLLEGKPDLTAHSHTLFNSNGHINGYITEATVAKEKATNNLSATVAWDHMS